MLQCHVCLYQGQDAFLHIWELFHPFSHIQFKIQLMYLVLKTIIFWGDPNKPILALSVLLHFNSTIKIYVAGLTWCFEGSRSTFGPGWRDAHLGCHAPSPRACLGHLSQRGGLLTGLLVLALGLRGRGGWGRLPAGGAAARVHACVQLLLNLLQVLSSGPAAAHLLLGMLGPASSLGLEGVKQSMWRY